ncbi:cytochrome c biogenesis protein CcdA [Pontibacter sp. G13]|uniref:protein-disulfide reductase DsbD family protein n=1 Tax=Pontibacter sp. G13 TaxID=3074898 RepID=UPI0028897A3F|nr:cytochrome c biogenesis protein CcdA [Pontibacter sp. G13]WNJ21308.1 protein-disulfide reductase DsbD family protein [Pontibacter sp. G13]
MIRHLKFLFSTLLVAVFAASYGQGVPDAVNMTYSIEPAGALEVGQEATLIIQADIDKGYHMYGAIQKEEAQMVAATFHLEDATGVELVGKFYDEGHKETVFDDVFEFEITTYHDHVVYKQKIKVTAENAQLKGYMRLQVCDDSRCVPGTFDVDQAIETKVAQQAAPTSPAATERQPEPEQVATPTPKQRTDDELLSSIHWTTTVEDSENLKMGDQVTLVFSAKIDNGFHVYSSIPPKKPMGLPTTFNLNGRSKGVKVIGKLEEIGTPIREKDEIWGTNEEVTLFQNKVTFRQVIEITEEAPVLDGYLSYQVCDETKCTKGKVELFVEFKSEATTAPASAEAGAETPTNGGEKKEDTLGGMIVLAIVLGFGSLLTPCVFPMIPFTISFFTKQSGSRAKGIRNAIIYGLSIIVIYTGLTTILVVLFGAPVIQEIANSPTFNVFFFVVLVIFALSFLGMFEIALPSSWSTSISKGSDRGGLIGIFLLALGLVVTSFSCTGPIVASVLGTAATTGEVAVPILVMLAYSASMAIPFMLLAIFPSLLKSMPKSGGWMNSLKVVLGFGELALALIYLSRADLVMHWGLLDREIFIGAWIVIFSMVGLYLLGKIRLPHDYTEVEQLPVPRLILSMISFWFVLYLVPGLWGAPLKMLGGFFPSGTQDIGVLINQDQLALIQGSGGAKGSQHDICNYPDKVNGHLSKDTPLGFCAFYDLEQGLEYAKKVNKPVFLDFTGHTCSNCRHLEKSVWPDPAIKQMITEEYVLISLYTDDREKLPKKLTTAAGKKLRTVGDKWINFQFEQYGNNSQPYYVLMDHDKSNLIDPTGYDGVSDEIYFRDFFKRGLEEFKRRHP